MWKWYPPEPGFDWDMTKEWKRFHKTFTADGAGIIIIISGGGNTLIDCLQLEEGESPFDCVRREVYEETGVIIKEPRYRGIITFVSDKWGTEYMHLFTATDYDGEIDYDCDEGTLEWVKKERVPSLPIWEGDKIFFDLMEKEERFFSLKLCYEGDTLVSHTLEF
jgi:8-oxo-dGTP diphosphatase